MMSPMMRPSETKVTTKMPARLRRDERRSRSSCSDDGLAASSCAVVAMPPGYRPGFAA